MCMYQRLDRLVFQQRSFSLHAYGHLSLTDTNSVRLKVRIYSYLKLKARLIDYSLTFILLWRSFYSPSWNQFCLVEILDKEITNPKDGCLDQPRLQFQMLFYIDDSDPLSSAQASLRRREAGRKKKKARGARWEGEKRSLFPLPIVPLALAIFSIIALFIGIASGSLCGGESHYPDFPSCYFSKWSMQ